MIVTESRFESFRRTSIYTVPRVLVKSGHASDIGKFSLLQSYKLSQANSPLQQVAIISH